MLTISNNEMIKDASNAFLNEDNLINEIANPEKLSKMYRMWRWMLMRISPKFLQPGPSLAVVFQKTL